MNYIPEDTEGISNIQQGISNDEVNARRALFVEAARSLWEPGFLTGVHTPAERRICG